MLWLDPHLEPRALYTVRRDKKETTLGGRGSRDDVHTHTPSTPSLPLQGRSYDTERRMTGPLRATNHTRQLARGKEVYHSHSSFDKDLSKSKSRPVRHVLVAGGQMRAQRGRISAALQMYQAATRFSFGW